MRRVPATAAAAAARGALLLALALLLASPAMADQNDSRLYTLFQALRDTQDPARAAFVQQRIWSIWFEHPDARIRESLAAGEQALAAGRLAAAVERFSEVIRLDPEFAEGWNRRATAYYAQGRYPLSLADVTEVLAREPRHFGALAGRGLCFQALGRTAEAIAAYRQALEINPHMEQIRARLESLLGEGIGV